MAFPQPIFRRRLAPLVLITGLLLSACAAPQGQETAEPAAAPPTTPAEPVAPTENVRTGCVDAAAEGVDMFPDKVSFDHATGVSVSYRDNAKVVEVASADSSAEPARYLLVQCGTEAPPLDGELADAQVVEVPVAEAITLTTTNLPHFDELGAVDALAGVGTAAYVTTPSVVERAQAGEVEDFATPEGSPDLERILAADPDLLILDDFGDAVGNDVGRLVDAGVPTVLNVDFNEQQLLGRAEWLKFTALFLNAEAAANETFDEIAGAYDDVAAAAAEAEQQPSVFANQPFEGTWYMPGGASYFANAVTDAGGQWVFDDNDSTGSVELDIETVLDRAGDADVWLQAGSVTGTLDDLLAADERFDEFKAFRDGEVWAYDLATNEAGGNPVFETAYTRADLFLADLVAILHPDALPDHEFVFFGKVPEGSAG